MCLLEQAAFSLEKGTKESQRLAHDATATARRRLGYSHRAVPVILDSFDLDLSAPHGDELEAEVLLDVQSRLHAGWMWRRGCATLSSAFLFVRFGGGGVFGVVLVAEGNFVKSRRKMGSK